MEAPNPTDPQGITVTKKPPTLEPTSKIDRASMIPPIKHAWARLSLDEEIGANGLDQSTTVKRDRVWVGYLI